MKQAVILAAGRGSRMRALTADRPKCLVEIMGRPMLHWQLDALRAAGLGEVCVVTGYRAERLRGDFTTLHNPRWAATNMVSTLLCADEVLRAGPSVISYSDIVYRADHVRDLMRTEHDVAITYDTGWEALWSLRFEDPLEDAETFRAEDGLLTDIGDRPSGPEQVRGQFMGLLRFTPRGWDAVRGVVTGLPPADRAALDTTGLLRLLLASGIGVGAVPVTGGWVEADSAGDLEAYETAVRRAEASGMRWSHDWREAAAAW